VSREHEKLSSRLGFILLSAGCAIGIGNVWRFPYVTGQSGGGWFVLLYFICLAFIGIPVLVMEFAAGRASQRSIAKLHAVLTPEKRAWRLHGIAGTLGLIVLMMFYTTVAGWMLVYFCKTAAGSFAGLDADGVDAAFGGMLADPWMQIAGMLAVCEMSIAVCAIGLQRGLERITKWMMLALLVLIVVLAGHSFFLDNALKGVRFFLVPDWAQVQKAGVANVVVNAMNQAFFTLSLGIGSMAIFGSYIGKDRTLWGEAVNVTVLDTFVAVCSGFIIIPACFAFGIAPGQGPGLIFVTLPNIFNQMAGGRVWGALFFLFMSFAALTTVLAVFEGILASIRDYTGWSRGRACAALAIAMPILSVPCVLGFNVWSGWHPLGGASNVLDLEDFIVSDVLLPGGGLAFALFCCHRYGWGWKNFVAEADEGEGPKFPKCLRGYCAYGLPFIIVCILAVGFLRRFFGFGG